MNQSLFDLRTCRAQPRGERNAERDQRVAGNLAAAASFREPEVVRQGHQLAGNGVALSEDV